MSKKIKTKLRLSNHVLLNALLKHSADNIYFKDLDGQFLRISDSQARWLNLKHPSDAVGLTDRAFFTKVHADQAARDEKSILQKGKPLIAKTEKETWPDGRATWVSSTKLPLTNSRGEVIGIFGISRDVTAQHLAEQREKRLVREIRNKNKILERDLKLAAELFSEFANQIPEALSVTGSAQLKCASFYQPANILGGDFFLIKQLAGDITRIFLCDVMGHGIQSALVAMLMRTWAAHESIALAPISDVMANLNRHLVETFVSSPNNFTATAIGIDIHNQSGTFICCSAGHPPPLIRRTHAKGIDILDDPACRCPGLGLIPDGKFQSYEGALEPGDLLLLYTDGLIEARNHKNSEFELSGVITSLSGQKQYPVTGTIDCIMRDVGLFTKKTAIEDDICLVAVERLPV